jgi:hypothetical protein
MLISSLPPTSAGRLPLNLHHPFRRPRLLVLRRSPYLANHRRHQRLRLPDSALAAAPALARRQPEGDPLRLTLPQAQASFSDLPLLVVYIGCLVVRH